MGARLELLAFRKKRKLTQEQMAEMLEITPNHYSRLETGKINPSFELMERFKETFPDVDDVFKIFEKCQ